MTYNKENIIGVEFTVNGSVDNTVYTVKDIRKTDMNVVISWSDEICSKETTKYNISTALHYLNNGTWIAKNNDLTTPNKGIN